MSTKWVESELEQSKQATSVARFTFRSYKVETLSAYHEVQKPGASTRGLRRGLTDAHGASGVLLASTG